jgi:hypothetical protein
MAIRRNIATAVTFLVLSLFLLASYLRFNPFPDWGVLRNPGHKPRYIFVDLGANGADSLEVFLQHEKTKFKYDFPRPEWATHDQAGEYPGFKEESFSPNLTFLYRDLPVRSQPGIQPRPHPRQREIR